MAKRKAKMRKPKAVVFLTSGYHGCDYSCPVCLTQKENRIRIGGFRFTKRQAQNIATRLNTLADYLDQQGATP